MGHRTLKRVPLDFQWPLGKVWKGYINPHSGPIDCHLCGGSGYNAGTKQIADDFYDFANTGREWSDNITQDEVQVLVDANRLWNFTRVPLNDKQREDVRAEMANGGSSWLPYNNGYIPTAEEVNELNRKPGLGHDSINRWILIEARAKRLKVFGTCPRCKGRGAKFPAHVHHRPYKAWREHEPPAGTGYQLWETTSNGSPRSPVFASAEELALWCTMNATIFADMKTSYENWLSMFTNKANLEIGSLLVGKPGFIGAAVNAPR